MFHGVAVCERSSWSILEINDTSGSFQMRADDALQKEELSLCQTHPFLIEMTKSQEIIEFLAKDWRASLNLFIKMILYWSRRTDCCASHSPSTNGASARNERTIATRAESRELLVSRRCDCLGSVGCEQTPARVREMMSLDTTIFLKRQNHDSTSSIDGRTLSWAESNGSLMAGTNMIL